MKPEFEMKIEENKDQNEKVIEVLDFNNSPLLSH